MLTRTGMNKHWQWTFLTVAITAAVSSLLLASSATAKTPPTSVGREAINTVTTFHVGLQGRPTCHYTNVVTVTFCRGTGDPLGSVSKTLNSCGYFTDDLPSGTYAYSIYTNKYLVKSGTFAIPCGCDYIELGTLKGGDANTNNIVNATDYSIFSAAYPSDCGYPEYDERADFDDDCDVDDDDYTILQSNYGTSGDVNDCP